MKFAIVLWFGLPVLLLPLGFGLKAIDDQWGTPATLGVLWFVSGLVFVGAIYFEERGL